MGNSQMPFAPGRTEFGQQYATPGDAAGQNGVLDSPRLKPRQQGISRAGEMAYPARSLMRSKWKIGFTRQVFGLIGKARAQTAGIAFLQPDDIELHVGLRQRIQIALLAIGQHMRPGARDIFAVCPCNRTGLDIAAKELYRHGA